MDGARVARGLWHLWYRMARSGNALVPHPCWNFQLKEQLYAAGTAEGRQYVNMA